MGLGLGWDGCASREMFVLPTSLPHPTTPGLCALPPLPLLHFPANPESSQVLIKVRGYSNHPHPSLPPSPPSLSLSLNCPQLKPNWRLSVLAKDRANATASSRAEWPPFPYISGMAWHRIASIASCPMPCSSLCLIGQSPLPSSRTFQSPCAYLHYALLAVRAPPKHHSAAQHSTEQHTQHSRLQTKEDSEFHPTSQPDRAGIRQLTAA